MADVKELKEGLEGAMELSLIIIELAKDGVQFTDAFQLMDKMKEPEIAAKLHAGYMDSAKIPAEIADLSAFEMAELSAAVAMYLPKFLSAIMK